MLLPSVKLSVLNGVNSPEMPYIIRISSPSLFGRTKQPGIEQSRATIENKRRQDRMFRLLKLIFILAILAFLGLVGYAYLGDMTPERGEITEPVELNVDK